VAADLYAFGPFRLDPQARRLTRGEEPLPLSSRQFDLLLLFVARPGQVLSKDALIDAAWQGIAVTDNSLEQAISALRRTLKTAGEPPYIETLARRGYRFAADVHRVERREEQATLDALLAPHRAWIEGRAALETLERDHIVHARDVFTRVVDQVPDAAAAHVGLANARALTFEMTRADRDPDRDSLDIAARHAHEACRLDSRYGEAWATLGFVLARTGDPIGALAASRRAVTLEPDNWRHHVRLAYVAWGEERLRAARHALALLPGFPLAHWLAATVLVARQAHDDAERELQAAVASHEHQRTLGRFSGVALHWLLGLLRLAAGDAGSALRHFELELAAESSGHLYARECCANTWYAIGALRLRSGAREEAEAAFGEALKRVPTHPLASAGLTVLGMPRPSTDIGSRANLAPVTADLTLARASVAAGRGDMAEAVHLIERALDEAPPGSTLWLLPVEPLLAVSAASAPWQPALARLRNRAA
jgi:DNA-binding winged helix-turn-helix (wHTH) protein